MQCEQNDKKNDSYVTFSRIIPWSWRRHCPHFVRVGHNYSTAQKSTSGWRNDYPTVAMWLLRFCAVHHYLVESGRVEEVIVKSTRKTITLLFLDSHTQRKCQPYYYQNPFCSNQMQIKRASVVHPQITQVSQMVDMSLADVTITPGCFSKTSFFCLFLAFCIHYVPKWELSHFLVGVGVGVGLGLGWGGGWLLGRSPQGKTTATESRYPAQLAMPYNVGGISTQFCQPKS